MLWDVSDFCGVQILTYCILSNHFHVLVRVPASTASGQEISDEELLRRFRVL
jgi:REP element-mobilizing transposase RayT